MSVVEHIMFEIERKLPYIEDRDLRHWLRQITSEAGKS
jgi:hypothetical protein